MAPTRKSGPDNRLYSSHMSIWRAALPLDGVARFIDEKPHDGAERLPTDPKQLQLLGLRYARRDPAIKFSAVADDIRRLISGAYQQSQPGDWSRRLSDASVFQPKSGSPAIRIDAGARVVCLAWLPAPPGCAHQHLALCTEADASPAPRCAIQVWRLLPGVGTDGLPLRFSHGFSRVSGVKALPGNGKRLALACEDGLIRVLLLNDETRKLLLQLRLRLPDSACSATALDTCVCRPNLLAAGFSNGKCAVWHISADHGAAPAASDQPDSLPPWKAWTIDGSALAVSDIRLHPLGPPNALLTAAAGRRIYVFCVSQKSGEMLTPASVLLDGQVGNISWALRHDAAQMALIFSGAPVRLDCSPLHGTFACASSSAVTLVTIQEVSAEAPSSAGVDASTELTETELAAVHQRQLLSLSRADGKIGCLVWNNNLGAEHLLAVGCEGGLVRVEAVKGLERLVKSSSTANYSCDDLVEESDCEVTETSAGQDTVVNINEHPTASANASLESVMAVTAACEAAAPIADAAAPIADAAAPITRTAAQADYSNDIIADATVPMCDTASPGNPTASTVVHKATASGAVNSAKTPARKRSSKPPRSAQQKKPPKKYASKSVTFAKLSDSTADCLVDYQENPRESTPARPTTATRKRQSAITPTPPPDSKQRSKSTPSHPARPTRQTLQQQSAHASDSKQRSKSTPPHQTRPTRQTLQQQSAHASDSKQRSKSTPPHQARPTRQTLQQQSAHASDSQQRSKSTPPHPAIPTRQTLQQQSFHSKEPKMRRANTPAGLLDSKSTPSRTAKPTKRTKQWIGTDQTAIFTKLSDANAPRPSEPKKRPAASTASNRPPAPKRAKENRSPRPASKPSTDNKVNVRWMDPNFVGTADLIGLDRFISTPKTGHIQYVRWPDRHSDRVYAALVIQLPGRSKYKKSFAQAVNDLSTEVVPPGVWKCSVIGTRDKQAAGK